MYSWRWGICTCEHRGTGELKKESLELDLQAIIRYLQVETDDIWLFPVPEFFHTARFICHNWIPSYGLAIFHCMGITHSGFAFIS